jgi:hypothetical protein
MSPAPMMTMGRGLDARGQHWISWAELKIIAEGTNQKMHTLIQDDAMHSDDTLFDLSYESNCQNARAMTLNIFSKTWTISTWPAVNNGVAAGQASIERPPRD